MLSSDVSAGFDQLYADRFRRRRMPPSWATASASTSSRARAARAVPDDADAEYLALIRDIMDKAGMAFQTCELGRIGAGGGGMIAYILAEYGMQVIESGVAVLSMHSLWEVANKADIYEAFKGYRAFIERA